MSVEKNVSTNMYKSTAHKQKDSYYINRLRIKKWTVEQIAEELNCSVPTVYRVLKQRGLTSIDKYY